MKTFLPFRIKSSLIALIITLFFAVNLFAQQHYNFNTGGTTNSFPFNIATGKQVQLLYLAGDFAQPTPAPSGNITKLYFKMNAALGPWTYTNFVIKMGQAPGFTTFATGMWYAGTLTTVYDSASVVLSAPANGWLEIPLEIPFAYDNTQSLIVDVQQCGVPGATGFSTAYTTLPNMRRNAGPLTTGACPFLWGNQGGQTHHIGFDVAPAAQLPDVLYYKFERNPNATTVVNCGLSGTPTAPIAGVTLTSGGQYDSCITGTAVTSAGVTTGWNNNLGTSSWTIGMWVDITSTTFGYLFGDGAGSFRCFNNGAAGTNAITLRGTGITNVDVTGFASGPVYVHFVYDSALANIKVYKNGVLDVTVAQTPLNLAAGTGFRVGGYTTSAGFNGKMDEFRLYRRALGQAEITATWNTDLGDCELTAINNNNTGIPSAYKLEQNYPNPFNPSTMINFSIPRSGMVDLRVFDILGREVAVLVNGMTVAGNHTVPFDASSLATGVYFYTLVSGDFRETKKMLLVK
jgi:hypothetical protein